MWALRILTGPQAGQFIELKMGKNVVGRAPQCDVKLTSPGVSKEHTEINVLKDKILVTDLKSSNGTYLNGIRIQNGLMRLGDKLGIHDILCGCHSCARSSASNPRTTTGAVPTPMPQQIPMSMPQGMPQPMAGTSPLLRRLINRVVLRD